MFKILSIYLYNVYFRQLFCLVLQPKFNEIQIYTLNIFSIPFNDPIVINFKFYLNCTNISLSNYRFLNISHNKTEEYEHWTYSIIVTSDHKWVYIRITDYTFLYFNSELLATIVNILHIDYLTIFICKIYTHT